MRTMQSPLWPLLASFSWQELRCHPWRNAAAVVAVMLGVALAFSVHLINASALDEFSQASRAVSGQPDLEVRSTQSNSAALDEAMLGQLLRYPEVALASPVLEISTYAITTTQRIPLRVLGVDALQVAGVAPDLFPVPASGQDRLVMLAPGTVFLNASARTRLPGTTLQLQHGLQLATVQVAGSVRASGPALAVMDIGAAQDVFQTHGFISRVDVRLRAGTDMAAFKSRLLQSNDWPRNAYLATPADAQLRIDKLSQAYRVNLTVLALVALFTGGFLVFSVLSLSVSRRAQQFALLGVLGLNGVQRLQLVMMEATVLGVVGSVLGVGLGTGLAAGALQLLGGDLGGGYFSGGAPVLQWRAGAAWVFGGFGVAVALLGAWVPARLAQRLPPAQTLKGLGTESTQGHSAVWGVLCLLTGAVLAFLPPVWDLPLGAYASVALLLVGGIAALPWLVGALLQRVAPWVAQRALPLLAVERARRVRESAAVAVSGVVAALSLAVALTVMVASFRNSVMQWLDSVLPAALYVRTAQSGGAQDTAYFDPAFVTAAAQLTGVERISAQRNLALLLNPAQPAVTLIVRSLRDPTDGLTLPLTGAALPVPPGHIGIYVSEAMLDLHGVRPGSSFPALSASLRPLDPVEYAPIAPFFVAGVWRDYARQFGTVAMDSADFARFSTDRRANDLAFWLTSDAQTRDVQNAITALANTQAATPDGAAGRLLEFGSAREIRATSLRIFDRSFAVTYWLQAVAIGIGLFGVAASFSAQVLARRKEFGLLAHLGLTRSQILRVVALEGAAWTTLGAIAGIGLGLAVAVVLVHVVNPQSFHWTMDLSLPWMRLLALGAAVIAAGTLTAWLSGRAAAGHDAVLAVKEDW